MATTQTESHSDNNADENIIDQHHVSSCARTVVPLATETTHLNHGRRLTVGELLNASLALHDVADFNGQVRVLLFLPDLQAGEKREPGFGGKC